jgi:CRP/FNR family transcriptional regulator, cyclic AMP receptor protein
MEARVVRVLEVDPELGEGLDGERMRQARPAVRAATCELSTGAWREPDWPSQVRLGLGLLVLDGLIVRRVQLDGRFGAELLSAGDLLRPWQEQDEATASIARVSGWRVLERAQVAVLDLAFARRIAPYPEIQGALLGRTLRRARYLTAIMAIVHQPRVESRLLMLLWHLADRCGIVRREGVLVPMCLTHETLADIVAARRPTISAALSALQRNGLVRSTRDGWLLSGSPQAEPSAHAERSRPPAPAIRSG